MKSLIVLVSCILTVSPYAFSAPKRVVYGSLSLALGLDNQKMSRLLEVVEAERQRHNQQLKNENTRYINNRIEMNKLSFSSASIEDNNTHYFWNAVVKNPESNGSSDDSVCWLNLSFIITNVDGSNQSEMNNPLAVISCYQVNER